MGFRQKSDGSFWNLSRRKLFQMGGLVLGLGFGSGGTAAASPDDTHQISVTVDPDSKTIHVTEQIQSDSAVEFTFNRFQNNPIPGNVTLSIISSAETVRESTYRVDPDGGVATFKYEFQFDAVTDCPSSRVRMLLEDETMVLDSNSLVALPSGANGPFNVSFDLPDEWKLYTPEKVDSRQVQLESKTKLKRFTIMAGVPKFDSVGNPAGPAIRHLFLLKEGDPCFDATSESALGELHDIDPSRNAEKYQAEVGFYIKELSEIYDQSPPPETTITPASGLVLNPDWGFWQTSPARRRHHDARHLGEMLDSVRGDENWVTKWSHFFADKIVYDYTGERRLLGNRYFKFLVFVRSQGILTYDKSQWPSHNRQYAYYPVQAWYTDHLIREKSDGEYSLRDLKSYSSEASLSKERTPEQANEFLDVDISDEFQQYILDDPAALTEKFPLIKDQYGEYLEDLLNHQRQFSLAPDILFYAFIELTTRPEKALPSKLMIMLRSRPYIDALRSPDFGGVKADADVAYIGDFYEELQSFDEITEEEFLDLLNKYTNDRSDDFFDFYSKHSRTPSIADLNYFLEGNYQKLLQKQLFVEESIGFIEETVPENREVYEKSQDAKSLLESSRNEMDDHKLDAATTTVDEAIAVLREARQIDESDTGIPDLKAFSQNIDPDTSTEASTITEVNLDGYETEWRNVETIDEKVGMKVAKQGESVYVAIKQAEPFFSKERPKFELQLLDSDYEQVTKIQLDSKIGSFIPGITDSFSLEDHSYIGAELIELEIPVSYLEFHGVSDPHSLEWDFYGTGAGSFATSFDENEKGSEAEETRDERTTEEGGSEGVTTTEETDTANESTESSAPGFGIFEGVAAIGSGAYLVKNRLMDDSDSDT